MEMKCPPRLSESEVRELAAMPLADLQEMAACKTLEVHGHAILLRGLIEFSNYCGRDCLYCGIRKSNSRVNRYRLTEEEILASVRAGFDRGLRTFVLQSGEDCSVSPEDICRLTERIKELTAGEAAVTLSCGIFSAARYREMKNSGADRYLLRFETSDSALHQYLRNGVSLKARLKALDDIRAAGLQLGSGFMTGLPGETEETLIRNILLCGELNLDMGGIGPFIPHPGTPLKDAVQVPIDLSLRATAMLRLMLPCCHIPATTAAGSLDPEGREKMIRFGANVLMPNITPVWNVLVVFLYGLTLWIGN